MSSFKMRNTFVPSKDQVIPKKKQLKKLEENSGKDNGTPQSQEKPFRKSGSSFHVKRNYAPGNDYY